MGDNDIKPEEYELVTNPQTGEYYLEDGYLTVQCNKTGNMVEVLFDNVANFYNLEKIDNGDGTFTIRSKNVKKKVPPATSPGGKGIKEWEINETKRIIQLTTAYTNDVGPMKRFATKKVMWKCIAEKLTGEFNTHVTPTQVENRMKTVSKINKKRVEHNRTSGNNKMITPYDSDFDLLSQKDPTVDPILLTQDGEIPGGSGSGNPSRAPGYSAIDTSSAVETNSSESGSTSGSKNHPGGETETVANESDGDIDMTDQEVQKQKADKKKKKRSILSVVAFSLATSFSFLCCSRSLARASHSFR